MIISVELCQTVIPIFGQQVQRSQSVVPGQAGVSKGNTGPLGFASGSSSPCQSSQVCVRLIDTCTLTDNSWLGHYSFK